MKQNSSPICETPPIVDMTVRALYHLKNLPLKTSHLYSTRLFSINQGASRTNPDSAIIQNAINFELSTLTFSLTLYTILPLLKEIIQLILNLILNPLLRLLF